MEPGAEPVSQESWGESCPWALSGRGLHSSLDSHSWALRTLVIFRFCFMHLQTTLSTADLVSAPWMDGLSSSHEVPICPIPVFHLNFSFVWYWYPHTSLWLVFVSYSNPFIFSSVWSSCKWHIFWSFLPSNFFCNPFIVKYTQVKISNFSYFKSNSSVALSTYTLLYVHPQNFQQFIEL